MVSVKGLPVLVDAVDRLHQRGIRPQTYLVGSGEMERSLRSEVRARGLDAFIHFTGSVTQDALAKWYQAADFTVLPSLSEGVPNVLLESIACGTPFVASEVGGIPEIATLGVDRLVPPGDSERLASAIEEQLQRSPKENASRDFMPFDCRRSAEQLIRVVEQCSRASGESGNYKPKCQVEHVV
jgi:glycosyltransferase involved in cell wall biosynthesis